MTYRSLIEIIAEILQVAKNGAKKTRILNSCNLTYSMTGEYITYLLESGFLKEGNSFHTTEKGLRFLQAYRILDLLLNTSNWHAEKQQLVAWRSRIEISVEPLETMRARITYQLTLGIADRRIFLLPAELPADTHAHTDRGSQRVTKQIEAAQQVEEYLSCCMRTCK